MSKANKNKNKVKVKSDDSLSDIAINDSSTSNNLESADVMIKPTPASNTVSTLVFNVPDTINNSKVDWALTKKIDIFDRRTGIERAYLTSKSSEFRVCGTTDSIANCAFRASQRNMLFMPQIMLRDEITTGTMDWEFYEHYLNSVGNLVAMHTIMNSFTLLDYKLNHHFFDGNETLRAKVQSLMQMTKPSRTEFKKTLDSATMVLQQCYLPDHIVKLIQKHYSIQIQNWDTNVILTFNNVLISTKTDFKKIKEGDSNEDITIKLISFPFDPAMKLDDPNFALYTIMNVMQSVRNQFDIAVRPGGSYFNLHQIMSKTHPLWTLTTFAPREECFEWVTYESHTSKSADSIPNVDTCVPITFYNEFNINDSNIVPFGKINYDRGAPGNGNTIPSTPISLTAEVIDTPIGYGVKLVNREYSRGNLVSRNPDGFNLVVDDFLLSSISTLDIQESTVILFPGLIIKHNDPVSGKQQVHSLDKALNNSLKNCIHSTDDFATLMKSHNALSDTSMFYYSELMSKNLYFSSPNSAVFEVLYDKLSDQILEKLKSSWISENLDLIYAAESGKSFRYSTDKFETFKPNNQ